jgi:hypothetical protein
VNEDRVARLELDVLPGERLVQIVDGDLIVARQHRHAFLGGHVNERAARENLADILYAELGETGARAALIYFEAIVQLVANGLVVEAIELRAHLANLGDHDLPVRAPLIGRCIHEGAHARRGRRPPTPPRTQLPTSIGTSSSIWENLPSPLFSKGG